MDLQLNINFYKKKDIIAVVFKRKAKVLNFIKQGKENLLVEFLKI
ncbi:hypothetical protein AsAng_0017020 [Aureispira anguillae]|uniref:Uncharacterized protein n=1 Tax=Aureispira anguillae TaxID=2864201 RepID=A0A916DSD6_9BACT|nr:hypothetical protein AsAng_0017020 [Aureispira anguillae]